MRQSVGLMLLVISFLMGCNEDYYPPALYGSQVERILAGTFTEKTWIITDLDVDGEAQPLEDCMDSIKIVFLSNTSQSSINAYDLRYQAGCQVYDSIYYGLMSASTAISSSSNSNVFTDTLFFEGGTVDYLVVQGINPEVVRWVKRDSVTSVFRFIAQ